MIPFAHDNITADGDLGNGNSLQGTRFAFARNHAGYVETPFARMMKADHYPVGDVLNKRPRYFYELAIVGGITDALGRWEHPHHRGLLQNVSSKALDDIRSGRAYLLINASYEGDRLITDRVFETIHDELVLYRIPEQHVSFMTSNLNAKKLYADWWKADCRTINIIELNLWGAMMEEQFRHNIADFVTPEQASNAVRNKAFLCFNRRTHVHRQVVVSQLLRANLIQSSLVSMSHPDENEWKLTVDPLLWEDFPDILDEIETMKTICPLTVDHDEFATNHAFSHNRQVYLETFFSVVTETIFSQTAVKDEQMFFSEKVFKPIANLHPFILVGRPNSLARLREMGYKTFDGIFDETYDTIENDSARMFAIVREIERLAELGTDALQEIYSRCTPLLEHNRDHFVTTQHIEIDNLRNAMLEFVESGSLANLGVSIENG